MVGATRMSLRWTGTSGLINEIVVGSGDHPDGRLSWRFARVGSHHRIRPQAMEINAARERPCISLCPYDNDIRRIVWQHVILRLGRVEHLLLSFESTPRELCS